MSTPREKGTVIEESIAKEAAILTGIGMGTAFSLLVLLLAVITLVHLFSARILRRAAERTAAQAQEIEAQVREKALAAAIAVTALVASPKHIRSPGGDGG